MMMIRLTLASAVCVYSDRGLQRKYDQKDVESDSDKAAGRHETLANT